VTLMVGGRNHAGPEARLRVTLDGDPLETINGMSVPPGFFLHMQTLPPARLNGAGDYATLTIAANSDQVGIEQFDAAPMGEVVCGFGAGWHEQEYNPTNGRLWRWSSERAIVRIRGARGPLAVRMSGEIEAASTATVVLRVGEREIAEQVVGPSFELATTIPAELMTTDETLLTVETSESYVPAERGASGDRRRLGLKVFALELTPAS
jgi:hypothetical protein